MSNKITQETIDEEIEGSLRDVRPVVRQVIVRHVADPNEYELAIQAIFVITLGDDSIIDVGMALPHGYVLMSRSSSSVTPSLPLSSSSSSSSSRHIGETLNGVLLHHVPSYAAAKQSQIEQQLQQLATQQQQQHQHQIPEDTKHQHEMDNTDQDENIDDSGPSYSDEPLEGY